MKKFKVSTVRIATVDGSKNQFSDVIITADKETVYVRENDECITMYPSRNVISLSCIGLEEV